MPEEAGPGLKIARLLDAINTVLIGKEEAVRRAVATLIARGHLLIEDVPGIGKTLLGLALARSIDASFKRIQFTNDLLPADVLGLNIYDQKEQRFEFHKGPIFSSIVLADEINRSTPKTQSALLEAMSERQVSIDGKTHPLAEPFLVIATENPVEYHGTFPLPEAQLDRFLMRVQIGYPSQEDEKEVLRGGEFSQRLKGLKPVLSREDVLSCQDRVDCVRMDDALVEYVVAFARATRSAPHIKLGLSPRGSQALCRAARAAALIQGRDYCVPDDVKAMAIPVAAHRLVFDAPQHGIGKVGECEALVAEIISRVAVPK